jgi:hypothetical protein
MIPAAGGALWRRSPVIWNAHTLMPSVMTGLGPASNADRRISHDNAGRR